ncbi:MAG: aminodeoxychorismate synthase component I [Planctomycetota bacterium]
MNAKSEHTDEFPIVARLPANLTAVSVFEKLARQPHVIFFDSVTEQSPLGRYSFVAADPFEWIVATDNERAPLSKAERAGRQFTTASHPDLPPFQGGAAGLFGYEVGGTLENIPTAAIDDLPIPKLAVGLYDLVFAFDHQQEVAYIVSQGFPETNPRRRRQRAQARIDEALAWLKSPSLPKHEPETFEPATLCSEQFDVGLEGITSNMSADGYRQMIRRAVEYIHAGDVFQVNLAQRLVCRAHSDPLELYSRLRETNSAPYAGYLDTGEWQICSTSPECFLTVRGREVKTRPIKGTRGRSLQPEADLFVGDELQLSEKDRAENVMIVDLMRNDLSRVCHADSVHVSKLCAVETYAFVKHLVSSVRGTLRDDASPFDLLRACFPGGSITGAPKIRAMQLIAELEPTTRGAYCGSLAYIGFDGRMDSNILIRTVTAGRGWWQLPVGGGIVAQSQPDDEYRETWHKARGMLSAIKELAVT